MEPALKPFTRQAGSAFDGCVLQAQNVRCSNPTNQSMVYRAIYRFKFIEACIDNTYI